MSESPWNVKSRNRRAPRALSPQSAQVNHIPHQPPDLSRPKARMRKAAPKQPETQAALVRQQPAKRNGSQPSDFGKPIFVILLSLLVLLTAAAAILLAINSQRLDGLIAKRESERLRVEQHRQEHLRARENSGYIGLIEQYAREFGVNPSFVSAIIKCESSYRPDAVSSVNARGLMQIMPDTGTWLAGRLKINNYQPEHLFDPETNIRFGTYYLAYLSDMFAGSPVMTAAAYHAGDKNVKHWALLHAEDKKTIGIDQIPMGDTRSYVGKVMDAYAIYNAFDQGGTAAHPGLLPAALAGAGSAD